MNYTYIPVNDKLSPHPELVLPFPEEFFVAARGVVVEYGRPPSLVSKQFLQSPIHLLEPLGLIHGVRPTDDTASPAHC